MMRTMRSEKGFSLIELLAVLAIASTLSLTVLTEFFNINRQSFDHQLITRANEQARTLLDYIAYDLRMVGAGLPLGQSGFDIQDPSLGDAPLPLLLTSNDGKIVMRANEKGFVSVLTENFNPSLGNSFSVFDPSDLDIGDTVYLSDMPTGGSSGLMGVVQSISGNTITLAPGFIAGVSATFSPGASVNRVTTITYKNTADGVEREGVGGRHLLQANSSFEVEYLDAAGNPIALPLTAETVALNLTSIRLTVSVTANRALSTGVTPTITAEQVVTLRNLVLMR